MIKINRLFPSIDLSTRIRDNLCKRLQLPIIPRGAGTSLSGAVLAVDGGVMIALTRMDRILNVDVRNRRALVEAGCVNAWITRDTEAHGLFFAPVSYTHLTLPTKA